MIDFLQRHRDDPTGSSAAAAAAAEADAGPPPDHLEALPVIQDGGHAKPYNRRKRRAGVSAEPVAAMNQENVSFRVIPKSDEDGAAIREAVRANILFTALDSDQMDIVVDAMEPKEYRAGETIIQQGDDGDDFYVLHEGECDCYVDFGDGEEPRLVKQYSYGESFGELALMYNCPRAASIKARTDVKVWAMDRITFRTMLMDTTNRKRKKYEGFLRNVPLFSNMENYERSKIADALEEIKFTDGQYIIAEGDIGHELYILKSGEAAATKVLPGSDSPTVVMRYAPGDFFGELALIRDEPRAANVISVGECEVVSLDRDTFQRMMGPLQDLIDRQQSEYSKKEADIIQRRESETNLSSLSANSGGDAAETKTQDDSLPVMDVPSGYRRRGRRAGLSAEPLRDDDSDWKPVVIPKTDEQLDAIRTAIANNFLFASLDAEQTKIVLDAMFEVNFKAGDYIIRQGESGDSFFVLDQGIAECYVKVGDKEPMMVKTYEHSESFGELALMYGSPRAASIKAKTDCTLWAMDRVTFRRVIMTSTRKKREKYQKFLENVPLLESLDKYERSSLADALQSVQFKDGERIITKGENGDNFFILERGVAIATKEIDGKEQEVYRYDQAGQFFGELALLHDQPRAANVIAVGDVQCLQLDRASFNRLLGPLDDIMHRTKQEYEQAEERIIRSASQEAELNKQ
eukprot:TRINITY_DN68190_c4_g1_i2.p2 TRINITY_DN68190_c4_g1~~TRINITY_DN68190_c4_g1_i2.p2  ORF type:complete len:690 (-),score=428.08 TRINITY_DN68190_c4_g1_i2:1369-3438(-)